jgi:hypothetical protein
LAAVGGEYQEVSMGQHLRLLQAMRKVRDLYRLRPLFARARWIQPALDDLAIHLEGPVRLPADVFVHNASHYLVTLAGGREIRVAVDADDDGSRIAAQVLAWSDVYFKTNFWANHPYPAKVLPLVNADPLVIPQIATFRAYRTLPKERDLCMVVRVWGGKDEVEGIEHNLRLLEAVARARCSKFLYAYLVAGDVAGSARRLSRQGIPCGTAPVPPRKLWRVSATSRLNVVRLGMHYCIPWRVTGALAIGSAMVLDRAPLSSWPEPLREGTHFLALGAETGVDRPLASDAEYAAIPEKIEAWLARPDLPASIGRNNGDYYDRFLDPARVGEHIVAAVERYGARAETTRSSPA